VASTSTIRKSCLEKEKVQRPRTVNGGGRGFVCRVANGETWLQTVGMSLLQAYRNKFPDGAQHSPQLHSFPSVVMRRLWAAHEPETTVRTRTPDRQPYLCGPHRF
jgi:hypothetical protein